MTSSNASTARLLVDGNTVDELFADEQADFSLSPLADGEYELQALAEK